MSIAYNSGNAPTGKKKKKEEEATTVASSSASYSNKMAKELEKQKQEDTGFKRAQEYFKDKTIAAPDVSSKDINSFLKDTKSYFQKAQERYSNNTYSTSKKNADEFFAESDSMRKRANSIRVYLSYNKDNLDKDTYNQLKSALDAFDSGMSNYKAAFAKANNYYSNWQTEDAYNEAMRQAELQNLSLKELENKVKENEAAQKEVKKNKSSAFWINLLDSVSYSTNNNKTAAGDKIKSDSNAYKNYSDEVKQLKEEGAELRSYLNTAKDNEAREKIGKIGGGIKETLDKISEIDRNISFVTQAQSSEEKWNNNSYSSSTNEDYKNQLIKQRQELKDRLKGMASQYGFKDENELVDYYEKYYNERQTEALKTEIQDFAKEHPVLAEGMSLALNDIYADTGIALGSMLGTALDKDGTGLDQNSAWFTRANIRNAVEQQNIEGASDKIKIGDWDFGKDAYQMVHSALDSAVSMLQAAPFTMMFPQGVGSEAARKAIQTLGTTLISSRSAVQEIINQKENGASDMRAVSKGAAAWVIETLTETVGLDTLLGNTKLGEKLLSKGLIGIVLNNMVGGVTEGSEELVGNWLTRALDVIDNMSTGEKSEWMKKYDQLVLNGVDKKEAAKQILSDMLSEDRESFIVGFGSGAGMASVGSVGNAANALGNDAARIMQGAEIRAKGNPDALINYARNIDADVKTKNRLEKLAQKAVRKESTAQKYKDRNNLRERIANTKANSAVGRLYSEILDEADRNDTKSAIRERLTESGKVSSEEAKVLADIVFKEATGEELTKSERKQFESSEEAQSALKELISTSDWKGNYGTRNAVENAAYGVDKETALKVTAKANKNVPVKQIARVKAYTPTSTVYTDAEGNVVNGDDITLGKGGDRLLELVNRKGDVNYANIVLENYDGQSVVRYTNAASRFYDAGRNDESFDAVKKIDIYGDYIDENTARALYQAGKRAVVRDVKGKAIKADTRHSIAKHYSDEEYAKKTKTGGVIRNYTRKLNIRQKGFVTFASKVGEKFGVVFIIDDTIDGGRTNGFYNFGNEIHIALDARGELYTAVAGHELYHYLKQNADRNSIVTFNKTVLDALKKNGFDLDKEIQKEREGKYGDTMTDDEIIEEIIADNCFSVLTSETIEDIVKKDASLGQKIKDFLSKFIEAVREAGGSLNSDMTKYLNLDDLESIEKQFATLLEEARNKSDIIVFDDGDIEEIENLLNDTGFVYDEQSDSLNFDPVKESRNYTTEDTLEDWSLRKKSIKEAFTAAGKKIGLTDEQIDAAIKTETFMVKYAETIYGKVTEENGKFIFNEYRPTGKNPYRKNSDYPQGTIDFSTCCPKRATFTKVFERLQRNRANSLFTAEDVADLRQALLDRGYTVQCGLCYVEDRRQLAGEVADMFIKDWKNSSDKFVKINSEGKETVLTITGTAYKKWANILKRSGIDVKKGDVINPSLFKDVEINQYLINTAEGYEQLTKDAPYVAMAYDVYNNSRGMQVIRRMDGREEYDRQILKWSQKTVDKINRNGGLRLFSYSDFEVAHMIDLMQIVMDCQVRGIKIQCYTKQKEFVEFAKKTGIKLNRSFIPKGKLGYHMEGNTYVLDFDAVEGIGGNDSEYLNDNYDDIGNIIIGINEKQIRLAMADDRINFIIPFHTSKETVVNRKLGVGGWVNYKDSQTEKDAATGKGGTGIGVNIYNILSDLESKYGNNITEEMFVNAFLDECKQNNWTPRFAEFLNKENGEYVFTPGYYKFLVDFKLFDTKTGRYLPQTAVRAEFDLESLKKIMESDNRAIGKSAEEVMADQLVKKGMSEKEAKAKVKKDLESIGKEVNVGESKIKASRNAEYLNAVENGNEAEAQKLVDEAAKEWGAYSVNGKPLHLYHGTVRFGFTEFDLNMMGDKRSIFLTSDLDMAQSYSGVETETEIGKKISSMSIGEKARFLTEETNRDIDSADSEYMKYEALTPKQIEGLDKSTRGKVLSQVQRKNLEGKDIIIQTTPNLDDYIYVMSEQDIENEIDQYRNGEGNYSLYARLTNPLVIDAHGKNWNALEYKTDKGYLATTRQASKYAYDNGYDGVIFKNMVDNGGRGRGTGAANYVVVSFNPANVKSADTVTYDDNGNVIPLSERFTENKDIRFSLNDVRENLDTLEELVADDEEAAEIVKLLKDDFKVTNRHNLSREDIDRKAREIVKNWKSNYNAKKLADNLEKIYDYVANGVEVETENGVEKIAPSFETAFNAMRSLARELMEDSYHEADSDRSDRIKALKKELRNTRIYVDDITKSEIAYAYGSYEKFRRSHIGSLRLVNDKTAMGADQVYDWLRGEYPEFFDGDAPLSQSDMMLDLIDTAVALEPTYENEYFRAPEQISAEIAEDIYEGFFDIKEHKTLAEQQKALRQKQKARFDEKLEELKAHYEDRIKSEKAAKWERVAKEREQILNAVARKELRKESTANKQRIRKKIAKKVKKLNNLLVNPTDQKHIPEELKKAVTKYCELMSTTGVFSGDKIAALQTSYAKLAKLSSGDYVSGYDEDIGSLLEELAETLDGRRLAKLNVADLNKVLSIANNLDFIVTTLNEMEINGKREQVETAGNQAIAEADDKGTKKRIALLNNSFINRMKRATFYGNLKPVMFFKDVVTGKIAELYDDIAKGEDTWAVRMLEARDFFTETARKYNFYDWADYSNKRFGKAKKIVSFTTAQGKKVELSTEEALSLYCTAKRNQGLQHILGGGFIPSEGNVRQIKEGKGKVSYEIIDKTPIVLNQDDLVKLASALTEEQKQFGDEMVKYLSTDVAKYGNDTSMKLFGYRKYLESYYFPISSSENYVYSRQTAVQDDTRLKHQSMTKATVPNANNPIVISPFSEVWGRHINDMASYSSFVVALENFNKVWNFRERNEDGTRGMSVKNAVENAYGMEATSYINQLMVDINGGVTMQNDTMASILMSKFKKGAVMASLSVSIQQPSAIARALALVDSRYFLKTTLKGRGEKTYEEMMKYAPVAIIKEMGFFDTGMGRRGADWVTAREYDKAVSKEVGLSLANAKQKGVALFKDANFRDEVMAWLPGMMDKITWCHIWNAVKAETAAKTNLKGEKLLKKAGERFTQVIHETQVYDSVFSRSENMRSKNPLTQMATAFMAEPTTALNMFIDSVVNVKNGQIKNASRTVAALVSSYALNAFLVSFIRAARDDDDKNLEEKYLVNFVSEFLQNLNPANQIPYLRDIINLAKGYDVERSDMSVIADLINLTGQVGKTIAGTEEWTDENKKKLTDQLVTLFGVVSELSGVPVNNIIRDAKGVSNVLWHRTDDRMTWDSLWNSILKEYDRGLLAPFIKTKSNYDLYYDALIRGDKDAAERLKGGLDEEKINSRMLKLLKENEDIINAANSDTISVARNLADELVKKGFDEETVWKAIKGAIAKDESNEEETEQKESDSSDEIKALLKKDKRINQAAQLRMEGNKSGWEKIRDELVNEGYDRDTVNSLIKTEVTNISNQDKEETDKEAEDKSSEKSEYTAYDIVASLNSGRTADAQSYLDDIYEKNSKVYAGGAASAKSTIKSNITKNFKQQYIDGDRATRALIRSRLMALKIDGEPLYTEKNFNDWLK